MDIGVLTGQIQIEDQLSDVVSYVTGVIKTFTGELDGLLKLMGPVGSSFAAAGGFIAAFGVAAVTALGAVTASIIALGNRGSDVNDVADTFEKFSGSVDIATESLRLMQEGTKGTVTNFDLMKSASKLLAAEANLTSQQFGTLSKAAFVLQNQGLGGTKEMLDLVSQAMLTGRTRALEMKIGKIDLRKAEEAYAKSINTTRENLTQAGKVEAARAGILDALSKKVKEAGDQQRDFGETMDAAVIAVKNWGDALSSRVAESPRVMAAVHNIENAIKKAFGTESQSLLETTVRAIEKFADVAATQGPIIVNFIADAIQKTKDWFTWLEKVQGIIRLLTPITTGSEIVGRLTETLNMPPPMRPVASHGPGVSMIPAHGGAPTVTTKPPKELIDQVKLQKEFADTSAKMVKRIQEQEAAQWKLALSTRNMTLTIGDTIKARREELSIYPPLIANYSYLTEEMIDQRTGVERLNDSLLEQARILGNILSKEQEKAHRMVVMARKELEKQRSVYDTVYSSLGHVATILDNVSGKFAEVGVVAARTGQAMMDAFAKQDYVGMAVAGITGLITIWKKLTGPTEYEKRVRAANEEMKKLTAESVKAAGSMGRLALNARMVGINIKGAFDSKDPEFLKQVLGEMEEKTQILNAAMEEYGFTWQDLGEQYRAAALGDQFDLLLKKTQALRDAGINYDEILSRQAEGYSTLVQQAIATGTEIPLAMKGVLEDLVAQKKLLDANGVAFEDLEDVSWAKTLTQGFDQVTAAIKDLTDAIINGVGGAIDAVSGREIVVRTRVDTSGIDSTNLEERQPSYYASGGTVVPFRPRGSDTVPAMLTPGERVIPRGGGGGRVVVELNSRWMAETVVPEIPGAVKRLGIGRR